MIDPARQAQLDELYEKLLDVYLDEADPDKWTDEKQAKERARQHLADGGSKVEAAKIALGWKGERYWEKKNANQTMTMLINIHRLRDAAGGQQSADPGDAKSLEKDMKKQEREVKKRLARTRPNLLQLNGGKK